MDFLGKDTALCPTRKGKVNLVNSVFPGLLDVVFSVQSMVLQDDPSNVVGLDDGFNLHGLRYSLLCQDGYICTPLSTKISVYGTYIVWPCNGMEYKSAHVNW